MASFFIALGTPLTLPVLRPPLARCAPKYHLSG